MPPEKPVEPDVTPEDDPLFGHLEIPDISEDEDPVTSEPDEAEKKLAAEKLVTEANDKKLQDAIDLNELKLRKQLDSREERREAALTAETERLRQLTPAAAPVTPAVETNEFDPIKDGPKWVTRQIEIKSTEVAQGMIAKKETEISQAVGSLQAELDRVRENSYAFDRDKLTSDAFYKKFKKDIDAKLIAWQIPEANRSNPAVRREALSAVKGENIDAIVAEAHQKQANAPEISGGIATPADTEQAEIAKFAANPMVAKAAAGLGYTPEQYAKILRGEGITSI